MKWAWADFWGFHLPEEEQARRNQPHGRRRVWARWGAPVAKVVAAVLIVVFFSGLAAWIVLHVVRFFGRYWGMSDQAGE